MKQFILISALLLTHLTVLGQRTETATITNQNTQLATQDQNFITKALDGGNAEVMKGTLAKTRSKNQQIVSYGEMMERDHNSVNGKLKRIAQQRGITVNDRLSEESQQMYNRLNQADEAGFDNEFISQMVADHRKTIDLCKAQAANGSDPELKRIANEALPTLEKHMRDIENMRSTMNNRSKTK